MQQYPQNNGTLCAVFGFSFSNGAQDFFNLNATIYLEYMYFVKQCLVQTPTAQPT